MSTTTKIVPAKTGGPCAACPWRTANQGTPHPHGFYSKANLRRLWNGIKRGARMSCHPRDPRMAEFEGYEKTAGSQSTPECAGAQILIQRELAKAGHLAKDADQNGEPKGAGLRAYRKLGSASLTKSGIEQHVLASMFATNPITGLGATRQNINDPDVGYDPLGKFDPADWPLGTERT